ncbi:hypothetical protein Syun_010811 [Stephania yunnanensis]|uniref:Uncharacterized protein n=1 Tax=Stephania yunnanensis TaxID=152371 RepID=A0AAP0KH76_9MAGN
MGIKEVLSSGSDAVKNNLSPDLITPIGNACWSSYNMGCSALKSVNNGAQKLSGFVKDPESRERIGWCVAHPLAREGLKLIPGVSYAVGLAEATIKYHRGVVSNDKKVEFLVEQMNREIKEMQAENKQLKAELESIKGSVHSSNALTTSCCSIVSSTVAEKPEEVLSSFMLKGIKFKDLLGDQVIPIRGEFEYDPHLVMDDGPK